MGRFFHFVFMVMGTLLLFSCSKDQRQASKSLEGSWDVVAIESTYAEFSENGYSTDSTFVENGNLGSFIFGSESVDYNFQRRDTNYNGSGNWELSVEKVNEGFVRVNQFTLRIENAYVYDVQFEDATKNSEKNAKTATFMTIPKNGYGVMVRIELNKR